MLKILTNILIVLAMLELLMVMITITNILNRITHNSLDAITPKDRCVSS